jgi:P pilus assembly chaperone PapD
MFVFKPRFLIPRFVFVLIAFLAAATAAQAMSVSPVTLDLETTGKNKDQLNVVNDGATPLPVEIVISRMEMDESGRTSTKPAGDEFLLFPPQALIPPGAAQSFRLQWVGDPQIKQSQSYIFSVNQVPVRMPAGKSAIQVVFNFATIVNVAPPAGRAGIALVNAGIGKDDKGKLRPALTVKNPGNMHAKLTDATIKLAGGGWSQTLRPEELRQTLGVGLVQPGKTRRFLLPVDLPAGVSHVTASVDYKPAK